MPKSLADLEGGTMGSDRALLACVGGRRPEHPGGPAGPQTTFFTITLVPCTSMTSTSESGST